MTCGIYLLKFNGTDKVYVGKGLSIETRYATHINKLKSSTHTYKMMGAYTLYGMPSLLVLLECSKEDLCTLENEAIEIFNAVDNGFNTLYKSESRPSDRYTQGDTNGRSKYPNSKIEEVFHLITQSEYISSLDISKNTGVSLKVVADISSGQRHLWLKDKYPEKHAILVASKSTRNSISKRINNTDEIKVKSPEGVIYIVHHLRNFCSEHGLDHSNFSKLLRGLRKQHKNWTVA